MGSRLANAALAAVSEGADQQSLSDASPTGFRDLDPNGSDAFCRARERPFELALDHKSGIRTHVMKPAVAQSCGRLAAVYNRSDSEPTLNLS
jgi:hypothetical protein